MIHRLECRLRPPTTASYNLPTRVFGLVIHKHDHWKWTHSRSPTCVYNDDLPVARTAARKSRTTVLCFALPPNARIQIGPGIMIVCGCSRVAFLLNDNKVVDSAWYLVNQLSPCYLALLDSVLLPGLTLESFLASVRD